jgi:DNA transformation protein
MAVTDDYLEYVLDQLRAVGPATSRRMFGGVGLYRQGLFFGLIADNVLYFKVDDANRADFEAAGSAAFQPFGSESYAMSYYEVPIEVLEDVDRLREWSEKALAAAKRGKSAKRKRRNS